VFSRRRTKYKAPNGSIFNPSKKCPDYERFVRYILTNITNISTLLGPCPEMYMFSSKCADFIVTLPHSRGISGN
jgi:hypothetical protein